MVAFLDADRLGLITTFQNGGCSLEFLVLDHLDDVTLLEDVSVSVFHYELSWSVFVRHIRAIPFVAAGDTFVDFFVSEHIIECAEWA